MKTFFAVFCAILAAAVVISIGLSAKARLDQWQRAKQLCYVQMNSELAQAQFEAEQSHAEMFQTLGQDSSDAAQRIDTIAVLSQAKLKLSQGRILQQGRMLVRLLENKPFGLPLTADERKELDSARAATAKH